MQTSPIEVQKALKDIDYPVHKKDLIQHAKKHGADKDVMDVLEGLPDKEYNSPIEVSEEFNAEHGRRRGRESSKEGQSSKGRESSQESESSKGHGRNK